MENNWQYKDRNANGICDTFAHVPTLIPNAYTYQWLCVEAMDALRHSNNYRSKLYCIPDQSVFKPVNTTGMPPFSDFVTQARMLPGTLIVGMTLTVLNYAGGVPVTSAFTKQNNFYVNVTDDGTGVPFFSGWLSETQFLVPVAYNATGIAARSTYNGKFPWFPLTKPRVVVEPGIVSVQLCAKYTPGTDNPIAPQLVLICAEPCTGVRIPGECE